MREIVTVTTTNVLPDALVTRDAKNDLKRVDSATVNEDSFVAYNTKSAIQSESNTVSADTDIVMGLFSDISSVSTTLFGVYGETAYGHCKYN